MARARRGYGEGSVFQRADGRWAATVSIGYHGNGRRRRCTLYAATKKEVQQKLRAVQNSVDAGRLPDVGKLTMGQYLTSWLATIKPTIAAYTHASYDRDVRLYLEPHLGGVKVKAMSRTHVKQFYADLAAAKVSPAMIRKAGVSLGVALESAVNDNLLETNPARGVKKPLVEKKDITALDPDQLKLFLDAAREDRLFALWAISLDSGARQGEVFALSWADVDFTAGCIAIRHSLEEIGDSLRVKDCKTKQSRRRITLTPFGVDALNGHRQRMLAEGNYRADGPVFCDTQGGYLRKANVLHRSFLPILKKAGLPHFRPYDLRHTCATLLLLAGENPKIVSERLGHSKVGLTLDTYSHVQPSMQERAAAKLEVIFQATTGAKKAVSG